MWSDTTAPYSLDAILWIHFCVFVVNRDIRWVYNVVKPPTCWKTADHLSLLTPHSICNHVLMPSIAVIYFGLVRRSYTLVWDWLQQAYSWVSRIPCIWSSWLAIRDDNTEEAMRRQVSAVISLVTSQSYCFMHFPCDISFCITIGRRLLRAENMCITFSRPDFLLRTH